MYVNIIIKYLLFYYNKYVYIYIRYQLLNNYYTVIYKLYYLYYITYGVIQTGHL